MDFFCSKKTLVKIYASYTYFSIFFQELLMFQAVVLFHTRIAWNVLTIFLKLGCQSQNFRFWFWEVCVRLWPIMHRALAWNVTFKSLFFLVQSSLPCITRSQGEHGLEYGTPVSNHAIRQAYEARPQVCVNMYICMPLLYIFVQRMHLKTTSYAKISFN